MNRHTAPILLTLLFTVALAGMLPGCGNLSAIPAPDRGQSPSSHAPPPSSQTLPGEETAPQLEVADAARYRGTLVELTPQPGGSQLLVLEAAPGSGQASQMALVLTPDSRTNFPKAELALGDHLEVYYGVRPQGDSSPAAIIAANRLPDAQMVYYNGTLLEVSESDQGRRLLLQNLDTPENTPENELYLYQTIFWVGDEARLYLSEDQLVPGIQLNIFHKGIYTMSLPPQGIALEVRVAAVDTQTRNA